MWHKNCNTGNVTFRCTLCRTQRQGCSFRFQNWGISKFPTIIVGAVNTGTTKDTSHSKSKARRKSPATPGVSTRVRLRRSAASTVDPPTSISGRSSGESTGGVFTLDPFPFIDRALVDPNRTPTSLASATIELQSILRRDEGEAATLAYVVAARKALIEKVLEKLEKECRRLEGAHDNLDRMVEDEVEEEQTPVASGSGSQHQ